MPRRELNGLTVEMNRRTFISTVGVSLAGASLASLSCAGDGTGGVAPETVTGTLRGTLVDLTGQPQSVGRLYLLLPTGFNTEQWADPEYDGTFRFEDVNVGDYQLRYWGANLARVPEPLVNPVPVTVRANAETQVRVQIELGAASNVPQRDIYIGDFFFQEQPSGTPNATTVVPLGTRVCWYNVGQMPHTITGGPWGDSGPLGHAGNFIWPATELGTFRYSCSYHGTQMTALLQVVR
ncbi:MAG: hypothetical protein U0132_13705 [Gemmatimonadaceae bacterium]